MITENFLDSFFILNNNIIDSAQDIQNSLLGYFRDNGRNCILWKLKIDGFLYQKQAKVYLLMKFGVRSSSFSKLS